MLPDMDCVLVYRHQTVPDRIRVAEAPDPLRSCCLVVARPGLPGFLFILTLNILHSVYHCLSLSLSRSLSLALSLCLSVSLCVSDLTILLTSVLSLTVTSQRDSERIRNKIINSYDLPTNDGRPILCRK